MQRSGGKVCMVRKEEVLLAGVNRNAIVGSEQVARLRKKGSSEYYKAPSD